MDLLLTVFDGEAYRQKDPGLVHKVGDSIHFKLFNSTKVLPCSSATCLMVENISNVKQLLIDAFC